ncbi:hypothetical protein [Roseateles amylovorans]|uniref:WGR domain-containing protein n=1 Tax=Roseateles amylovorans TaxID=2978473 RepID=A0ABY6B305_9BURK|nr:hypothetical protein [Roseateles amylovorans]UXH79569.1 hypothetical protein N4261_06520 [Roseateles amylovorans]
MKKIASATLSRPFPREQRCTVELVALDLPGDGAASARPSDARFIVTVRRGLEESSLTAAPVSKEEAERRALDFIRRRLAAGQTLVRQQGFDALGDAEAPAEVARDRDAARPAVAAQPVPPAVAALVARFEPVRWKLESPERQARAAWRVAECSDRVEVHPAAQQALRGLVPRLVELLDTGTDLLDLCLAAAIGRLGDPGAAEAMRQLAQRGRSPATQRYARQAWLMLLSPAEREVQCEPLAARWAEELAVDDHGPSLILRLLDLVEARGMDWPDLLQDWYDLALCRADLQGRVLDLLTHLPVQAESFQAMRYLYKAAELRRDAAVIGLLHARFENTPAAVGRLTQRVYLSPVDGEPITRASGSKRKPARAYAKATRQYLRLRGWRHLRRLAALGHSHAPDLAVALLLGLRDDEVPAAHAEARYAPHQGRWRRLTRHYPAGAHWVLVSELLLPRLETRGAGAGSRTRRLWTTEPIDTGRPLARRTEALQPMWDAHPEALLRLALLSRSALVQAVVARALQDHAAFVERQSPAVLEPLLRSPYPTAAEIGFTAARSRVLASPPEDQVPWLRLMAASTHTPAQDFALLHIAGDPATFARFPSLVVGLLLGEQERGRKQGVGLALLADPQPLLRELLSALLAVDADLPGLAAAGRQIEQLLQDRLASASAEAVMPMIGELLTLLGHPAVPVVSVGVTWLLQHPAGMALLPPALMTDLLTADDPERRACGVRLMGALPDEVLRHQVALIGDLATHASSSLRAAISAALLRVARTDDDFARQIADRLHRSLFHTESGDGAHDDALRWLTGELRAQAPARDGASVWRALQARTAGAQRYGAWALADLPPAEFSMRQLATLARHADVTVRRWAMAAIDAALPPTPDTAQTEQLLPLVEAGFDDAIDYATRLFTERLPEASLGIDLLISLVDHPRPWVQALGRSRLVRRMSAAEASLCLTRLSQHPGTQVQLFVTQWLLELPTVDPVALAAQLRALTPYFLTVLSQVHRGRTAKSRVIDFLRAQTAAPETAEVVAAIFARQVVTASLTDKPQYIAGLRDISARHPGIDLPFVQWKTPAASAAPIAPIVPTSPISPIA